MIQYIKHRRAHVARQHCALHHGQRNDRQNKVADKLARALVRRHPPIGRQPAQMDGKDGHQNDAEQEAGHRNAQLRTGRNHIRASGTVAQGQPHTHRDSPGQRKQHRQANEDERDLGAV